MTKKVSFKCPEDDEREGSESSTSTMSTSEDELHSGESARVPTEIVVDKENTTENENAED